jgi:hypothetical protein
MKRLAATLFLIACGSSGNAPDLAEADDLAVPDLAPPADLIAYGQCATMVANAGSCALGDHFACFNGSYQTCCRCAPYDTGPRYICYDSPGCSADSIPCGSVVSLTGAACPFTSANQFFSCGGGMHSRAACCWCMDVPDGSAWECASAGNPGSNCDPALFDGGVVDAEPID